MMLELEDLEAVLIAIALPWGSVYHSDCVGDSVLPHHTPGVGLASDTSTLAYRKQMMT